MSSSKTTLEEVLSSHQKKQSWVEKYRPKTINDIQHQQEIVSSIKNFMDRDNIPHFLFYGPPGTGKTSTIMAIISELKTQHKVDNILELNASNERGINTVRTKIKNFAQHSSVAGKIKFIVLDESDTMTNDAQTALRRCMELYSKHTRFCLLCNYVSRIIDPIISRCVIYRFKPIPSLHMETQLQLIANSEKIEIKDESIKQILHFSNGDLRKAINCLEMSSYFRDFSCYQIPNITIIKIWKIILSGSFIKLSTSINEILSEGYDYRYLFKDLVDTAVEIGLSDNYLSILIIAVAKAENALIRGSNEMIELTKVIMSLFNMISREKKKITQFIDAKSK